MDNQAAALSIYDAINARRFDRLDQVLAPDASFHLAHLPTPVGRDEIKASMAGYVDAFPDMKLVVEDVIVDGDRATVRAVLDSDGVVAPAADAARPSIAANNVPARRTIRWR
jgi:ketosteroid isomerase-like protein